VIYGITSPLLCSRTKSFWWMSFSFIKSKLCKDTLDIVAPLNFIGSNLATGVIIQVLHT